MRWSFLKMPHPDELFSDKRKGNPLSAGDWKELYVAAQSGDLNLVRYHIEAGVDPNHQHPEILSTPLVAAILAGCTEVSLYLLANGAQADLRSIFDDLTPVEAASKVKNQAVLNRLREMGVRLERRTWIHRLRDMVFRKF